MDMYKGSIPIIDGNGPQFADMLFPKGASFGCIPRDYTVQPANTFGALPSSMVLIPESELDARYDEQEEQQSSLEHLYLRGGKPAFVNLDQDVLPDCWTFSTAHAIMFNALRRGSPIPRLNPHAIAVILNQLNGGWWGLSAKFARENGCPVDGNGPGEWPGHSRSRQYDTPALRTAMAAHKITEEFVDLSLSVYDQKLTRQQYWTALMNNQPTPSDFREWGHSVCAIRRVRIERGSWGPLIINSWLGWGRFGLAVIRNWFPMGAGSILASGSA